MAIPIPASLVRHLKERRCVLFVGAGLSAAAGLPGWQKLLLSMVEELESEGVTDGSTTELRALVDAGKLLEVADHCRQRLGERRYQEFLGEQLRGGSGDLPEVHSLVTRLPFSAVVTTNYDKLLERAYSKFRGDLPKVVTSRDRETLGSLLFSGGFFILKAHGDIDDAESLVLTARDYREIIHANAAFDGLFSALLMTRSLLIIGYSLSDPDFRLLLDRQLSVFGENIPERYAVMAGVGAVEADIMRRSSNIKVLSYPANQHGDVAVFLRALIDRLDADSGSQAGAVAGPPAPATSAPVPPVAAAAPRSGQRSPSSEVAPRTRGGAATPPPAPAAAVSGSAPSPLPEVLRAALPSVATRPAHQPLNLRGVKVHLSFARDRLSCQVLVDDTSSPAQMSDPVSWAEFYKRQAALLDDREPTRWRANYERLGRRLGDLLPSNLLSFVPAGGVMTLILDRDLADIPWELAVCGPDGRPLALAAPTVRRVVSGDSQQSRGLPGFRSPLRVLVVGDPKAGRLFQQLKGARREAVEIAELYRESRAGECTLLTGDAATLDVVVETLSSNRFDVIHFAGHAWFDQHESFLAFGDESLTASELRSLLGLHPPGLLVLNSHYTAFLPRGLRPAEMGKNASDEPPTWHIGFTQMAAVSGVGAFVGCFESPQDEPAREFGVRLHRELLSGKPIVESVLAARTATLATSPDDVSALQYVLSGHPGYCVQPTH